MSDAVIFHPQNGFIRHRGRFKMELHACLILLTFSDCVFDFGIFPSWKQNKLHDIGQYRLHKDVVYKSCTEETICIL